MVKKQSKSLKELRDFTFEFELLEECPLCGSSVLLPNGKVGWLDMDFWYVICGACGLKFMNPRPTQRSYQDFYKNLFWEQKVANVGFHMPGQMWNTKRYSWDNAKAWGKKEGTKKMVDKHRELRFQIISETLSR